MPIADDAIETGLREIEAARVLMAQMPDGALMASPHLARAARALAGTFPDVDSNESPWDAIGRRVIRESDRDLWKDASAIVSRRAEDDTSEQPAPVDEVESSARVLCDLLEAALVGARTASPPIWHRRPLLVRVLSAAGAIIAVFFAIWLYSVETSPAARARTRFPHIVLVSIDALHVDRLPPYNAEVASTPFLARFAGAGVHFTNVYTHTAMSVPSHASLMTGISPPTLGVMANGDPVPDGAFTLGEILADAGYRTTGFVSLAMLRAGSGITQGFDDLHDPFLVDAGTRYRRAEELIEPVRDWVTDHHEEPFFLWWNLSDLRGPYVPENAPADVELWLDDVPYGSFSLASRQEHSIEIELPPGQHRLRWVSLREPRSDDFPETVLEMFLEDSSDLRLYTKGELPSGAMALERELELPVQNKESATVAVEVKFSGRLFRPPPSVVLPSYEAKLKDLDRHLAELDALLGELEIREDTLVAIVSVYGEGLFTHDTFGRAEHVYEDELRTIWLMRGPGLPSGAIVSERPALLIDVAPTLLDILGLSGGNMEGQSLVGCWSDSTCPDSRPWWAYGVHLETRGLTSMASYRWPYKWVWRRGTKRLAFDVVKDPWEQVDLLVGPGDDSPEPLKQSAEAFRDERRRLAELLQRARPMVVDED